VLSQAAFQETFRPTSPTEVYSEDQPSFIPRSAEEDDWIPIDVLLGCYRPKTRTIIIFQRAFAKHPLRCNVFDLETIVRLHEYAHALVHLGIFWPDESEMYVIIYGAKRQTGMPLSVIALKRFGRCIATPMSSSRRHCAGSR
jgi:hypothetical protein